MPTAVLRNYAEAFYAEAARQQQVPLLLESLEVLAEAIPAAPEVLRVAQHPGLSTEEKLRLLLSPLAPDRQVLVKDYLRLLLQRQRFSDLPQLVDLLREIQIEHAGQQPVRLETCALLTDSQVQRLEAALKAVVGQEVHVTQQLVPQLLGGFRVHVSSEVLDESVSGHLDRMERFLQESGNGAGERIG